MTSDYFLADAFSFRIQITPISKGCLLIILLSGKPVSFGTFLREENEGGSLF